MSRKMKDCGLQWIDKIPEDWSIKPLKTIFAFGKGLPITKADLKEFGLKVISYGQIHAKWNTGTYCDSRLYRYVDENYANTNPASSVPEYGFIFADTSEDLEGCGNCAYIDKEDVVFAGYHTIILKPYNLFDNKYLAYLFQTDAWRYQIRKELTEVKVYTISQKVLKKTSIILPQYEEQQVISAFLDLKCSAIDDSITKHKAIIDKLEEYRKALITQTVTKGLELNVEMKDSGVKWIGKIPTSWDTIALKRLASIQTGNTPTKKEGNHNYSDDNGIPWIKAENLDYLEPVHYTSEYLTDEGIKLGRLFKAYTIFVCCIASVGKVGFSDIPCSCNQQINAIHFDKNKIFWKYGFYVLKASSEEHIFKANTSVQMILNSTQEGYIKLPVPATIDEQKAIANYLDKVCIDVNKMVDKHNAIIDKLKEYKQSLIYNAVTGKIDCRKEA